MTTRAVFIDRLRGLAVVLMVLTHVHDALLAPAARAGVVYAAESFLFAMPSRVFLALTGFALALRLERDAAGGGGRRRALRGALRRGLELFLLGLALRASDYLRNGHDPVRFFKVDILNTLGTATVAIALVGLGPDGRVRAARCAVLGGACAVVGAFVAGLSLPAPVPAPLGAYLVGARPLAWFPLVPWAAWAFLGAAAGAGWQSRGAWPWSTGRLLGAAAVAAGAGALTGLFDEHLPARVLRAEGAPSLFLVAAAGVVALATLTERLERAWPAGPRAPLLTLGKASLPVYLVHLNLVFGVVCSPWRHALGLPGAALATLVVTVAMLPVAVAWNHRPWATRRAGTPPARATS